MNLHGILLRVFDLASRATTNLLPLITVSMGFGTSLHTRQLADSGATI